MRLKQTVAFLIILLSAVILTGQASAKPRITLEEFFNSVDIQNLTIAPDGSAVVIQSERPDWQGNIFREELWLSRLAAPASPGARLQSAAPVLLTRSGHDSGAQWSPDSRWIAFLSERKGEGASNKSASSDGESPATQLWLIAVDGGEAFPLTSGKEGVHAFAWSADGKIIFYSTRIPWTKQQEEEYQSQWKDVVQWRAAERGDSLYRLDVAAAIRKHASTAVEPSVAATAESPAAAPIATSPLFIARIVTSRDGAHAAFLTDSISHRLEDPAETEIYLFDPQQTTTQQPQQLTHNLSLETDITFAQDGSRIYCLISEGTGDGPYAEVDPRLYSVDVTNGKLRREVPDIGAAVMSFTPTEDGGLLIVAEKGVERVLYSQAGFGRPLQKVSGWPGRYSYLSRSQNGRIAFRHSSYEHPAEVYVATTSAQLSAATAVTDWNHLFTERDLPKMKPYRWKADDGAEVEGVLLYPPGRFEEKNLRTLVLIHGGPEEANDDRFHADWYDWEILAASQGWLVFRPNYRGSIGYGDKFLQDIVPHIVSVPGKDILAGVDALVKDGIADPERLAIGGHSYGGYLTNWLITQTTRFKAAVSAAGAVEHAANWGYDDLTYDDAWYLGGRPWEASQNYADEAALFRMDKVTTPTHLVTGDQDIRVSYFESIAMERALHSLRVPSALLVLTGEAHDYAKNPWHGRIKVREELDWLEKYVPRKPGD